MTRSILLVDMNAFFISCEMAMNPALKGKPAAVAGDPARRSGIILAANYEARKFGVKTTMLLHEAKRLCPGIILVPPTHGLYEEKSRRVMAILSRYTPLVEQNSIDEAWLDVTGSKKLYGTSLSIAQDIMKTIMSELDLWCSIGISDNKFLAKMASEIKKPLGITELWGKDVREKLWPMPVRDMYGIGKQTEKKLNNMAILTVGDIASTDKGTLVRCFGRYGEELHRLANGIDLSPVMSHENSDSKSISRSTTMSEDIRDIERAKDIILRLSEEVGAEARKYGYKGKTVQITIKYGDFQSITRQKSMEATYLTKEIYKAGAKILEENWNRNRPVRLLGIGISNFREDQSGQLSIFDIGLKDPSRDDAKEEKLERAIDSIRDRFGTDKVKRAKTITKSGDEG